VPPPTRMLRIPVLRKQGDELDVCGREEIAGNAVFIRDYALGFKAETGEIIGNAKLPRRSVDCQCNRGLRQHSAGQNAPGADHTHVRNFMIGLLNRFLRPAVRLVRMLRVMRDLVACTPLPAWARKSGALRRMQRWFFRQAILVLRGEDRL